jgi:hypothetical protein
MIMTKLQEAMKQQSALTAKLLAGTITDDEKATLTKLTKAIEKSNAPQAAQTIKTSPRIVTLKEFKEQTELLMAGDPTPEQLALAKRNIQAVKDQGVTDAEGQVAVEIILNDEAEENTIDSLFEKIEALQAEVTTLKEKGFDGRTTTGVTGDSDDEPEGDDESNKPEGDDSEKNDDMPVTTSTAIEALTAIINRYTEIKTMIETNKDFSADDLYKMWPGWELRDAAENATAVLAKLEALKELALLVQPKLEALHKATGDEPNANEDEPEANEPEGDKPEGDKSETDKPEDDKPEETEEEKTKREKTEKQNDGWLGGIDMAPESEGGNADFQTLRKNRKN